MGLLDEWAGFVKTPEGQGLLSAAFGGLAGAQRGTPWNNLGRAGLAGVAGYGNAIERDQQQEQIAETNKYRKMQSGALQAEIDSAKIKATQEAAKRNALPELFGGKTIGGGLITPEMAGVPMFSQGTTIATTRTEGAGKIDVMAALQAGYTPKEISEMGELSNVGRQKVARTAEVEGPNGTKRIVQLDDYGQEIGPGMNGYVPAVQLNTGNKVMFTKPTAGQSFDIGMSPDARASNAVAWANNALSRERLEFDRNGGADGAAGSKAPAGYRWNTDRSALEPIPGGPAGKSANLTEGERKAATLMQRMGGSLNQLQAVTKQNPGAASPNALAEAARSLPFVGGDTPANALMSGDRQRVEAAQLDILDAALTLGTGAAYTKEQLQGYRRSYFPQIMDSAATIKDKQARLDNVLQAARTAAGRAAPNQPAADQQQPAADLQQAAQAELARRKGGR